MVSSFASFFWDIDILQIKFLEQFICSFVRSIIYNNKFYVFICLIQNAFYSPD